MLRKAFDGETYYWYEDGKSRQAKSRVVEVGCITQETDKAPEHVFLKACHPASPNHNCTWSVSKDQKDSVEYIRADLLATARREAFKDAIGIIKDFQTVTRPNFYDKYKVTTLMAALEASATEKGEMND